jgi:predicted acyltransferase
MPPPVAVAQRGDDLALAGLICGVLSNVCCCFTIVCAVLGIVFSVIALSRHDAHPQQGGKGMALAGLVLSVAGLTWHCILPLSLGFPPGAWWVLHHHWRH